MAEAMTNLSALAAVTITTFLVVVLTRAAWHKFDRFLETVGFAQGYGLVPHHWVIPIVRALMLAEIIAVMALILPATQAFGALVAAALFAGYGLLMGTALARGRREIDCGCGGLPQIVSGFTLGRNAVLVALSLCVAAFPVTAAVPPVDAAAAIGAGLVLTAIYTNIERLAAHIPYIRQEEH